MGDSRRYLLANYFSVGFSKTSLKLGFGSIQKAVVRPELYIPILDTCLFLKAPRTLKELGTFTTRLSITPADQKLICTIFTESRFLIEENAYTPEDRFSRPALYYNLSGAHPSTAQSHITDSHVAVLGCGGIGNTVAATVAAAGISQLTLLDDDTVEISNLTRQIMYEEEDVGSYKVEALAEKISKKASRVEIIVRKERFHSEQHADLLDGVDLIIVSGDSTGICHKVNAFAYKHKIPFLNIGYINDIAVWGPFVIPGITPCYRCFSINNISDKRWADQELLTKIDAINQDTRPLLMVL